MNPSVDAGRSLVPIVSPRTAPPHVGIEHQSICKVSLLPNSTAIIAHLVSCPIEIRFNFSSRILIISFGYLDLLPSRPIRPDKSNAKKPPPPSALRLCATGAGLEVLALAFPLIVEDEGPAPFVLVCEAAEGSPAAMEDS